MNRYLCFIFLSVSLFARENPFLPLNSSQAIGQATSIQDTRQDFISQSAKLPSSARILKSLELHYQNLDGSIESKVYKIDKNVDWHDELVLQKIDSTPSIKTEIKQVQQEQKPQQDIKKNINFKDRVFISLIEKNIWIKTEDAKIRDFLVTNPYKIVLDFKKNISFVTKTFATDTKPFKNIVFGNHDGYYRMVIELDGQYIYDISKIKEGYFIRVK